jgi:hypothetical protein
MTPDEFNEEFQPELERAFPGAGSIEVEDDFIHEPESELDAWVAIRIELAEELLQLVGLCEGPGLRTYIIWTPESGCSALRAPGHADAGPAGLHR